MRKFLIAVLGAVALLFTAIGSAIAADPSEPFVALDTDAGGDQAASAHSTVAADAVTLVWVEGEDASSAGTSAETPNLGIDVEIGDVITVSYETEDQAEQAANGAIRLFVYYHADADTWNVAPDQSIAAPTDVIGEDLVFAANQNGTLGTVGVVYDTSNGGVEGTVVFTNLRVDGESVPFVATADNGDDDTDNGNGNGNGNGQNGSDVADEVKNGGAPPEHSKGKGKGNGDKPQVPLSVPAGVGIPWFAGQP